MQQYCAYNISFSDCIVVQCSHPLLVYTDAQRGIPNRFACVLYSLQLPCFTQWVTTFCTVTGTLLFLQLAMFFLFVFFRASFDNKKKLYKDRHTHAVLFSPFRPDVVYVSSTCQNLCGSARWCLPNQSTYLLECRLIEHSLLQADRYCQ